MIPSDKPAMSPVLEMVATEVLLETQGVDVAAVPLTFNCKVASLQTDVPPVIVGSELTVIVIIVVFAH